jgi:hypothetical protein
MYWNFVAIDGVIKNQLATQEITQLLWNLEVHCSGAYIEPEEPGFATLFLQTHLILFSHL